MQEEDTEEVDNFGQGGFNRARKFIWELFEEPNKSKLGKVVFFLDNVAMACQPSLLARTQLMPLELYSHNLHLINRARAHHAHCRALLYRTVDVQQPAKAKAAVTSQAINCLSTAT